MSLRVWKLVTDEGDFIGLLNLSFLNMHTKNFQIRKLKKYHTSIRKTVNGEVVVIRNCTYLDFSPPNKCTSTLVWIKSIHDYE